MRRIGHKSKWKQNILRWDMTKDVGKRRLKICSEIHNR